MGLKMLEVFLLYLISVCLGFFIVGSVSIPSKQNIELVQYLKEKQLLFERSLAGLLITILSLYLYGKFSSWPSLSISIKFNDITTTLIFIIYGSILGIFTRVWWSTHGFKSFNKHSITFFMNEHKWWMSALGLSFFIGIAIILIIHPINNLKGISTPLLSVEFEKNIQSRSYTLKPLYYTAFLKRGIVGIYNIEDKIASDLEGLKYNHKNNIDFNKSINIDEAIESYNNAILLSEYYFSPVVECLIKLDDQGYSQYALESAISPLTVQYAALLEYLEGNNQPNINNNDPEIHKLDFFNGLQYTYQALNEMSISQTECKKTIDYNKDIDLSNITKNPHIYTISALLLMYTGEHDRAKKLLTTVVKRFHYDVNINYNLASLEYYRFSNWETIIKHYEKALDNVENGFLGDDQKRNDNAKNILQQLLVEMYAYSGLKQYKMQTYAEEIFKRAPTDFDSIKTYGIAKLSIGARRIDNRMLKDAIELFEHAKNNAPSAIGELDIRELEQLSLQAKDLVSKSSY
jgi:tetratricopeptide (TPR) repeat protein